MSVSDQPRSPSAVLIAVVLSAFTVVAGVGGAPFKPLEAEDDGLHVPLTRTGDSLERLEEESASLPIPWQEVLFPGELEELAALGEVLFALSEGVVYRSVDLGGSWAALTYLVYDGEVFDIDASAGALYAASRGGVLVSHDLGDSFTWSFDWSIDPTTGVDVEGTGNGQVGHCIVRSWGGRSGPRRRLADGTWDSIRGDLPYTYLGVLEKVVADPGQPANVAYLRGYRGDSGEKFFRTPNGGLNWLEIDREVLFVAHVGGSSYAFGRSSYSLDAGASFSQSFESNAYARSRSFAGIYLAPDTGGVLFGLPGDYVDLGLADHSIRHLAIAAPEVVFAASDDGQLFKLTIQGELFRDGFDDGSLDSWSATFSDE